MPRWDIRRLGHFFAAAGCGVLLLGSLYLPVLLGGGARLPAPVDAAPTEPVPRAPEGEPGTLLTVIESQTPPVTAFLLFRMDAGGITVTSLSGEESVSAAGERLAELYRRRGIRAAADGLADGMALTIDRYLILELTDAARMIDRAGPLEVTLPEAIYYRDRTTGYTISLGAGLQRLDGSRLLAILLYNRLTYQGDPGRRMDAALLEDWIAQNLTPAFCERLEDYFLDLVGCAETDLSMPDYLAARSNLQHLAAA